MPDSSIYFDQLKDNPAVTSVQPNWTKQDWQDFRFKAIISLQGIRDPINSIYVPYDEDFAIIGIIEPEFVGNILMWKPTSFYPFVRKIGTKSGGPW